MKDWRSISKNRNCPNPCSIEFLLLFFLVLSFLFLSCSSKRVFKKNPLRQHYRDATQYYLPQSTGAIQWAVFARADKAPGQDLILLARNKDQKPHIEVMLNRGKKGFHIKKNAVSEKGMGNFLRYLAAGDLNRDGYDDLVVLTRSVQGSSARLLVNNKKGYFYVDPKMVLPALPPGVNRVDLVDLDNDRDLDLFFTGSKILDSKGGINRFQALAVINNRQNGFRDATSILLPSLKQGIVQTSFADYNGDGVVDAFLIYGNDQNRLLINNGLGKFIDRTRSSLPQFMDPSTHADWADFDQDGDNDLLVTNGKRSRRSSLAQGFSYFLENDGLGNFKIRKHPMLPNTPSRRVYLLDANGSGQVDILILGDEKTVFLTGRGNWEFNDDSLNRLPGSSHFLEMAFADTDRNGYLDILGISKIDRKITLWVNRFD